MRFQRLPSGLLTPKGPEILVHKYADVEIASPALGMMGLVSWELTRRGKVIRNSGGWHKNLITDGGMDNMTAATWVQNLFAAQVGTGSATPAVTDSGLQAPVATAWVNMAQTVVSTYVAGPPDYWYRRRAVTFSELLANGNLTEFGIRSIGAIFFARQLLKDGTGTPTTIVKTSLDQLTINYEYRIYPPTVDVGPTVVSVSGVNYDVTTRTANAASGFGWAQVLAGGWTAWSRPLAYETDVLAARTSALAGTETNGGDGTQTAYSSGSFRLENRFEWDTGVANYATGIGGFNHFDSAASFGNGIAPNEMFQSVFSPKLPKTNTKKLVLYFQRTWARYP